MPNGFIIVASLSSWPCANDGHAGTGWEATTHRATKLACFWQLLGEHLDTWSAGRKTTSVHLSFHVMVHAMQELATAQPGHDASMAPQLDFTHPGVS